MCSCLARLAALAVVLGSFATTFAQSVLIDAGHGGHQPGAHYGVKEKDLTLDVARRLASVLRQRGIGASLTRRGDSFVPISTRRQASGYRQADLFVSIHFNSSPNPSAHGLETFYYSGASRALAANTQRHLVLATGGVDRGVKSRALGVLRGNPARAAILVECGFLSNRWENQRCAHPGYRQQLAYALAAGIEDSLRHAPPAPRWRPSESDFAAFADTPNFVARSEWAPPRYYPIAR